MIQTLKLLYDTVEELHEAINRRAEEYLTNLECGRTVAGVHCQIVNFSEDGKEVIFESVTEADGGDLKEMISIPNEEFEDIMQ